MYSYQTHTDCTDCHSAKRALDQVNKKLDKLGRKHFYNLTYLSSSTVNLDKVHDLIFYKEMLTHLTVNPNYYQVPLSDIISQVKIITS